MRAAASLQPTPLTPELVPFRISQVNKAFDKYEKQLKAAKASGTSAKANQAKVRCDTWRRISSHRRAPAF